MSTTRTTRQPLSIGPNQGTKPVSQWTDEQRRLACGWANHELRSQVDRLCAPYDWVPAWTSLDAATIHDQLGEYYAANS